MSKIKEILESKAIDEVDASDEYGVSCQILDVVELLISDYTELIIEYDAWREDNPEKEEYENEEIEDTILEEDTIEEYCKLVWQRNYQDAIVEISDGLVDICTSDLNSWGTNNMGAVENYINEYGWSENMDHVIMRAQFYAIEQGVYETLANIDIEE